MAKALSRTNKEMLKSRPTTSRMSESEKEQTYHSAAVAISIINQKHEALNKYRDEALTYAANNPGNYSFHFDMDFMKVKHKLLLGYIQNRIAKSRTRRLEIRIESQKIAKETGASVQAVEKLFYLLMSRYIQT